MAVTRVGNFSLHNNTMRDVADVQRRLAELQDQISSGIKARDFKGLNGQVEQFVQLEAKVRQSQQYIESNTLNISRMKTADQAMGQMLDIADSMENLIVLGRNSASGASLNFEQQMRNLLDNLSAQMNISFEGRYLFGGSNTGTPPAPDLQGGTVAPGIPDASYYEGSEQSLTYRMDELTQYTFPVRADDQGFQQVIAAAHAAINAYKANDDAGMGKALTLMQQGQESLVASRAKLNATIINVEDTTDRLTSMKLYWQGLTEQVAKTDVLAASTEVANNEAILQAAFQVFARLSQLRLSDYL